MDHIYSVARQFAWGAVLEVRAYGRGNVNDTFLVTEGQTSPTSPQDAPRESRFILQRLNTRVFHRPELVMANLATVTGHLRRQQHPRHPERRFEVPQVLFTRDGRSHLLSEDGSFWRALSFIDRAETFDVVKDKNHGREVGYALGRFHQLLADLPPDRLADTLPGFHVTPGYLRHYDELLAAGGAPRSPEVHYCLRFIEKRRDLAHLLEQAKKAGKLRERVIHGDPKVNNVMLDTDTGKAAALVDLDTVKPGLTLYDLGDCLRSGGNPLGEETSAWEEVQFDPDLAQAILAGYFSAARGFLTAYDCAYLYDSLRVLAFELGLRFFTDYLKGNVYFKARFPDHNLARALVQFKLTASIEAQADILRAIIRDLTGAHAFSRNSC
uniref:Aminoglycoside phosphotransferase family protein n=1 Tax=Desulfobacca acetoxidans TaxID=60893 RepID=A0A7C3V212_9BACT